MLRGETQGANRRELLSGAREQAEKYFDAPCVRVKLKEPRAERDYMINSLTGETITTTITFSTSFTATLDHEPFNGVIGQACARCSLFE